VGAGAGRGTQFRKHPQGLQKFQLFTLCNSMDRTLPGSSVHGTLQARILEWIAIPSSRGSSGIEPESLMSPALADRFFTTSDTWKALSVC